MTRKSIAITSLVLLLAGIAQAGSSINLDALQCDGYGVVPIKHPRPNDVEINGVSGKMVLDTGTGVTVVDQQFASKTKLGRRSLKLYGGDAAGNVRQSEVGKVQSFKVGGVPVYRPDVSVTSTALGNWNLAGLIGMDLLGQNRGIIDCGAQKLYLVKGVH